MYDDHLAASAGHHWLQLFCQHPLVHHSFFNVAATHHDLCEDTISQSSSRSVLSHKVRAIGILGNLLSTSLDRPNLEILLLAVLCLGKNEITPAAMAQWSNASPLPVEPHIPTSPIRLYGRFEMAREHRQAAATLVGLIGGLRNIRLPGLAGLVALSVNSCVKVPNTLHHRITCNMNGSN